MSERSRCEASPADLSKVGILYVSPPAAHTRGTLRRLLFGSDLPFGDPLDDVLAVEVSPEGLRRLCKLLLDGLSEAELRDCRALLVEKGSTLGLRMLSRMQNLGVLVAAVREEWLLDMLREDRLTVHFQPIVSAANPGEVFAYECLLRGIDEQGSLVSPSPMFEAARRSGLLTDLDRAARIKAVEEAQALRLTQNVFINFDPSSIYDPAYCLRSTIVAIERCGFSPERMVFEVTGSDRAKDDEHLRSVLDFCRKSGVRISLDDFSYDSFGLLDALRPDFVKLDTDLVRDVGRDPYKATIARKLLGLAGELGVAVVAAGVETEEQWRWLVAHGADFAQGYLFAKPAFPPPVLAQSNQPGSTRNPNAIRA